MRKFFISEIPRVKPGAKGALALLAMTNNNPQNLRVNSGVPSSRFVVDLKRNLLEEEAKQAKIKPPENLEAKIEKLAEVDYGKYFRIFVNYTKMFRNRSFRIPPASCGAGMTKGDEGIIKENKARNGKSKKKKIYALSASCLAAKNYLNALSNEIALIVLIKFLCVIFKKAFIFLYKICHGFGWTIVFALRLVYFFFLAIIELIEKFLYILFVKFHPAANKIFRHIPQDLQAKQAAAISIFARLLGFLKLLIGADDKKIIDGEKNKSKRFLPAVEMTNNVRFVYLKPALVLAGILLAIILPVKAFTYYRVIDAVKGRVLGASESAINNLMSAGESAKSFNFSQAGQGFERAGNNFLSAQNDLKEINGLIFSLASIIPGKNMQLAAASKNILHAGESSSNAGKNLSLAMESLFSYKENTDNNILENLNFYGSNAITNLTELTKTLEQINSDVIPESYQEQFILLKQKTDELNRGLSEFISLTDNLGAFLGTSTDKRYLLVFQNNSELRASGGFIGSFALIDFSQGKIKNIKVPGGGSYDTEAGFLKKIRSPEPLNLVRSDWHFWDANWWPDWPTSASKLAWFYENSDGSTVDGVIGFTPTVIENLLKIIGPVDLSEKYGLVINADNFWLETQKLAEQKSDKTKEPKKIIGDLMNKIIEELPKRLTKENLGPLFKTMEEALAGKNILFYFTDKNLEAKVDDLGWSGRIKNTLGDYLSVINTNIAGGKSDRKIKQEIIHKTAVQADGSIIDNLTVRRTHEAVKREPFSGVRNVNWVRIYVPLGSELLEADGFKPVDKIFFDKKIDGLKDDPEVLAGEGAAKTDALTGTKIYNEFNKTVFANWSQLDPGETIEINLKYRLPFKLTDKKQPADQAFDNQLINKAGEIFNLEQKNLYSYSLLAQKQPGMNSSTISSQLELGRDFKTIWKYPADLDDGQNGWSINENLNQDIIIATIVEEK